MTLLSAMVAAALVVRAYSTGCWSEEQEQVFSQL
jgi:hypothetical protein